MIEPIDARPNRMAGTRLDSRRSTWVARLGRWLAGDWWDLEYNGVAYGVWHPWRYHRWNNYRFSLTDAKVEQRRLNSGLDYGVCPQCGCTFASHYPRRTGGIECP